MYEHFYGLSAAPFSLLPDAAFLYLSARHRRAVTMLDYGLQTQAGFMALTGAVGAGKTTVLRRFMKSAGPEVVVGMITNPSESFGRPLRWIAMAFDIGGTEQDEARLYHIFVEFLLANYAAGKRTLLIIDEAQNFDAAKLEELRMLSNVNNEKDQLLQMVLVGQPELLETLKKPELRQFAQRIAVHAHLDPLRPAETAAYIRHRLSVVGGSADLFDDPACAAVHHFTGGVPRLVNLLCDQTMVYGFSEDLPRVKAETVADVVLDRARSGLSPFLPLPEGWSPLRLPIDIAAPLDEIRRERQGG